WKDLLVTNGYLRDFTDLDFLKYTFADAQFKAATEGKSDFKTYALVQKMPSNKLGNYIFQNNADLTFSDKTKAWGLDIPSISNAAAYADFDNDGDLDLIIGNNNEPVMLWRNNGTTDGNWLQMKLEGEGANTSAFGACVWLYANGKVQYLEQYPVRGFQSTVSSILHFGFPSSKVDSLKVQWPSGKTTIIQDVEAGRLISLREQDAVTPNPPSVRPTPNDLLFTVAGQDQGIPFLHEENDFIDFKVEVLMPYQLSRMGPALAKADVNGDGNEDVFVGGALGQPGTLFLQRAEGRFEAAPSAAINKDAAHEDVDALFFDADRDGDADLYVVSGGNEYEDHSLEYQDRLYLNDGKGGFVRANNALPPMGSSKQAVAAGDVDGDGDFDLFVGGCGKAGNFPLPSRSYMLRNDSKDGQVKFTDVTTSIGSGLEFPGMVTSATWSDFDADGYPELVIAGDWMPVMIFKNEKGRLQDISKRAGLVNTSGQWGALEITDIDGDGDLDIIGGNAGLNTQYKPSLDEPMTMHVGDFDNNGIIDPIISYFVQGKSYPMASRDELLDHIRTLRNKYIRYADYADATVEDIFSNEQLSTAQVLECNEARTLMFLNNGDLTFSPKELPLEAQFSKTNSIIVDDFDQDKKQDLLLLGNFFPYRPQLGESDASFGLFLKGDGRGNFIPVAPHACGLFADGDVRSAVIVKSASGKRKLVVGRNDDEVGVILIR
ncbi:MAG TPA: VCBS repeat-containing protein, partial [Chryseosolibacter sp.]|nr:VCBS repeat-containing protein [Chryseosolibacter sp.]